MKLIIDIPEVDYECAKQRWMSGNDAHKTDYYISKGIPLDDVKAEIREKSFNHYFEYGEYVGEDCRKERIIYTDGVLKILDNIGRK